MTYDPHTEMHTLHSFAVWPADRACVPSRGVCAGAGSFNNKP